MDWLADTMQGVDARGVSQIECASWAVARCGPFSHAWVIEGLAGGRGVLGVGCGWGG